MQPRKYCKCGCDGETFKIDKHLLRLTNKMLSVASFHFVYQFALQVNDIEQVIIKALKIHPAQSHSQSLD